MLTLNKELRKSGIKWLGLIPTDWNIQPVRAILNERKEKNIEGNTDNILSVIKDVGVIRYSDKGNVGNKSSDRPESYKIVHTNDIVLNSMNLVIGSVGLANEHGVTSSVYIIYYSKNKYNDIRYFYDLFRDKSFQRHLGTYGRGMMELRESVKAQDIKNQLIPVPNPTTQKLIADYLDKKIKLIDQIISKKQKLIELLKEKRISIITQAVTKGLDPKAKMKQSGVEWIGEIPSSWTYKKFKFISRLEYGDSLPTEERESGNVKVFGSNGPVGTHSISNTKQPTIIVGRKGSFGAINFISEKVFSIDTTYFIDKRHTKTHLKWLSYAMMAAKLNDISLDTGVPGLSRESVYNKVFPFPSFEQQLEIVNNLGATTKIYDDLNNKIMLQIRELTEYRSSLIYNAVTGKININ